MTTSPEFRLRDIALVAYGPSVVSSIGHGAIMPVLALRARELGADVSTAALVVAALGVGMLVASLPAGALVARLGERTALLLVGFLDAVAMVVAALSPSVGVLAAAVVVSGMSWTVFLIARQGFMIDVVPPHWRARAMSLLGGSYRVGVFVGPLLGAGLIALTDLRAVFWFAGGASVVSALMARMMPDLGSESRAQARESGHLSVWSVLRAHRRTLLTLGVAVVVLGASRSLRTSLLPLWADHVGIAASTTSLIFAAAAAIDLLFVFPGGWLMDTRGRMVVAVPVVASMAVACLVLPLARDAASVTAVMALIAVGNGLGVGHRDDAGRRHRAHGRPGAVPRRLAAVRRHRGLGRTVAGERRRGGGAAGHRQRGGGAARAGRDRVGGLVDPAGRPQPTVTLTSLEVSWVSVSIIRNWLGPGRLVCT